MVTPMKENEDINFEKIEEYVEYHINNGTDALIICGTTGEPSTQDVDEHMTQLHALFRLRKNVSRSSAAADPITRELPSVLAKNARKSAVTVF